MAGCVFDCCEGGLNGWISTVMTARTSLVPILHAIITSCGPLAQLVRAEDLIGDFLHRDFRVKAWDDPHGLLKASSLCLEVELLKFGEH